MVKKAVWLAVVIGAAGIAATAAMLFALQIDSRVIQGRFINEADATRTLEEKLPQHMGQEQFKPKFGYLKYEGILDRGDEVFPRVSWYSADLESAKVQDILHANITLYDAPEEMFSEKKDRYVWTASYFIPASSHIIFLDAVTGQIMGEWVPCPACICHHNGIMYK